MADRGALEQHAELVAAEAVGGAALGHDFGQPATEAGQQRVARGVAEGVVVALEAVEVEEGQCARPLSDAVREGLLEVGHERPPVGQPGQPVLERLAAAATDQQHVLAQGDAAADEGEHDGRRGEADGEVGNVAQVGGHQHTEGGEREEPGQRDHRPAVRTPLAPVAPLPGRGRHEQRSSRPQRIDERAGEVGACGLLEEEDRVRHGDRGQAEAEQQPRAPRAAADHHDGGDHEEDTG